MKSRPTVLIAEDDPVFRRVISFSIQAAGMNCELASNGLEAISIIERCSIDLIITDHQMPLCSGLELIEYVRSNEHLSSIPIILCTAKGFELNASQLVDSHSLLAVMRKPFSPRQMVGLVAAELLHEPISTAVQPCAIPL